MKNEYPLHIEKQQEDIYANSIGKLSRVINKKVKDEYKNLDSAKFAEIENQMYAELTKIYLTTEFLSVQFQNVGKLLDAWAYSKLRNHINQAMRNNRNKFFSIVLPKDDPQIYDFIQSYTKKNIELVQALGKKYIPEISQLASKTFLEGGSSKDLAYQMLKFTDENKNKAKFWARDQAGSAYSEFTRVRQTSIGITEYWWATSKDNHVRGLNPKDETNHAQLEGMKFNWKTGASKIADAFSKPGSKNPGDDYNCITEDTSVIFDSNIIRCFRRWYSGETISIITESNKTLRVTPNHPILTTSGWKAAKNIKLTDNLIQISDKLIQSTEKNITNRIITAKQIFDFFLCPSLRKGLQVSQRNSTAMGLIMKSIL